MKYTDAKKRQPQHVMVFGDSKTGKSTLVSRLTRAGYDLIWLSCDGGHTIIDKLAPEEQEKIDIIILPDTRDFPIAQDTVRRLMKGDKHDVCHAHGMIDCRCFKKGTAGFSTYEFNRHSLRKIVVIDHLTAVTASMMSQVCKGTPDDYKPKLDDYGALSSHMTSLMRNCQIAGFNLICIAQTMEAVMEDNQKRLTPAVGSYEFGRNVAQYFDHIVYCRIKNKGHEFGSNTTYDAGIITGSRSDFAIEELKEPDLSGLFVPPLDDEVEVVKPEMPSDESFRIGAEVQKLQSQMDKETLLAKTKEKLAAMREKGNVK